MDNFNSIIDTIKEKVGEEDSALISDELLSLMTQHKSLSEQNEERGKAIESLKTEKEELVSTNAKLFRRIGFEDNEPMTFGTPQNETKAKEVQEIKIDDIINENGDII